MIGHCQSLFGLNERRARFSISNANLKGEDAIAKQYHNCYQLQVGVWPLSFCFRPKKHNIIDKNDCLFNLIKLNIKNGLIIKPYKWLHLFMSLLEQKIFINARIINNFYQ